MKIPDKRKYIFIFYNIIYIYNTKLLLIIDLIIDLVLDNLLDLVLALVLNRNNNQFFLSGR